MARVVLPQSKIKQRRKQRRTRIAIVSGVAFVFLLAALVGVTWVPALRASEVRVQGVSVASANAVKAFVKEELTGRVLVVFPKNSIFLYPKERITEKLRLEFPALHSAQLRIQVPSSFHTLVVTVDERKPVALWCGNAVEEPCAFIDETGAVYTLAPEFSDAVYVRYYGEVVGLEKKDTLPKQFLSSTYFRSLSALIATLQKEVGPIDRVTVKENEDARVSFGNGFAMLFVVTDDGADILERFMLARDAAPFAERPLSDFEYLDLRFGDKLYYKLKTE